MLYVDQNNVIRLTRGDTARFSVTVKNDITKNPYDVLPTDTLIMTIKKSVRDSEPCVQKKIVGSNVFHILPTDTSDLPFGRYVYDVQLTTNDSDVYTVVPPTVFELMKEVTY